MGEVHKTGEFAEPRDVEAAKERKEQLIADIQTIQEQLGNSRSDPAHRGGGPEFFKWRMSAKTAMKCKLVELRFLKEFIARKSSEIKEEAAEGSPMGDFSRAYKKVRGYVYHLEERIFELSRENEELRKLVEQKDVEDSFVGKASRSQIFSGAIPEPIDRTAGFVGGK